MSRPYRIMFVLGTVMLLILLTLFPIATIIQAQSNGRISDKIAQQDTTIIAELKQIIQNQSVISTDFRISQEQAEAICDAISSCRLPVPTP